MPCGGIFPTMFGAIPTGECIQCGDPVRPNDAGLFVEEWDAVLHRSCLGYFLCSEEGEVVLLHGHEIVLPEIGIDQVSGRERLRMERAQEERSDE